jgi:flagellar hook-associated protein 2
MCQPGIFYFRMPFASEEMAGKTSSQVPFESAVNRAYCGLLLEKKVGISSPGIGSGLIDVNGIISKLMAVEAAPLAILDKKVASYNAKLSALGSLSGAVSGFQGALSGLTSISNFQSNSAISNNTDVMVGSATSKAVPGAYQINVTQLAQAQTLATAGRVSTTTAIGLGGATTLSFQLGTTTGGTFGLAGAALGAGVTSGGIANGSLSINGTAITTDALTRSAKALAEAVNAKSATSGVTATAAPTSTSATLFGAAGVTSFGDVDASGGTYALSVAGIELGAGNVTAASLDATLAGSNSTTIALAAAGIAVTGTAALGTLQFVAADGNNLAVTEAVTGAVLGGIGKSAATANSGSSVTASSTITLSSTAASPILIAGSNPAAAGLVAGSGGSYIGGTFTQNASQVSGTVLIDSTNNSLQGIRDAINKANVGVTATIVSDGSATPNHLVLTSTKTGAASSMKIAVSGSPADTDIANLLGHDPAGVQNLTQNAAAQSTLLSVNGIAVASENNNIAEAIQGVTLTIGTVGKATLTVAQDSTAVKSGVTLFVKAYNELNKSIKEVSGYDPASKKGGALLGDSTVQTLQAQLRKQLTQGITGLTGEFNSLSQVGISFQKDGTLALDASKLDKAVKNNFTDVAALFAAVGKASDSLVSFQTSTAATKPGDYALELSALASQGSITSAGVLPPSTTIAAATTWNVSLNQTDPETGSRTASFSLAAGSYTPAQLATLFQSAINGAGTFAANELAVNATVDGAGKLNIVSAKYGSVSKISLSSSSGTTFADIFGAAAAQDGVDIAGTIGGSAATGSGQVLTGSIGSPAEGMKVEVTGGATGARGTVGFSQGYAYQLNNLTTLFLGAKGLIAGKTDGIGASIKDIAKQKEAFGLRLGDIEKRYRAQYTALDVSISSMSATSSFLSQQLASMQAQLGNN